MNSLISEQLLTAADVTSSQYYSIHGPGLLDT